MYELHRAFGFARSACDFALLVSITAQSTSGYIRFAGRTSRIWLVLLAAGTESAKVDAQLCAISGWVALWMGGILAPMFM